MPPPACRCATPSRSHERADRDARVELARLRQEVADRTGVDPAPVPLELGDDLHRPHLRRARDGARREARAQQLERGDAVAQLAHDLRDEMRHVRVPLGLHEALDLHRARHAHAREVVAAEVDEHRVLGPVLLRREQRRRVALAGRDRPRDRVELGAASGALDDRLGRAADERDVPELQEEEIRRRVDATQRAVELDGGRRRGARRALCDHDLEDVALADVLLRALDAAQVLVARRLALERPARRRAARQGRSSARRARVASPRSSSATPRAWSKRSRTSGTRKTLSGTSGPSSGSGTVGSKRRDGVVAEVADDRLAERSPPPRTSRAASRADEAVAPEPAALDRLEQERAAPRPRAGVR